MFNKIVCGLVFLSCVAGIFSFKFRKYQKISKASTPQHEIWYIFTISVHNFIVIYINSVLMNSVLYQDWKMYKCFSNVHKIMNVTKTHFNNSVNSMCFLRASFKSIFYQWYLPSHFEANHHASIRWARFSIKKSSIETVEQKSYLHIS